MLVQVNAASLNPIDYKMCEGWMEMVVSYPFTPGFDFAGRVVRVGGACERLKVGDLVYGMTRWQTTGCLAEYVAVRESMAALKVRLVCHVHSLIVRSESSPWSLFYSSAHIHCAAAIALVQASSRRAAGGAHIVPVDARRRSDGRVARLECA